MSKYEAVVFDLDGTLLNTIEDLTDSVNAALGEYHCPQKTVGQIRSYVGNGIRKLIERCLEGGANHPHFQEIFQAFRIHYQANCKNKTKPYEGILDLLRALNENGIRMAIVSNKADFAVKELNAYYFSEFLMTAIGERTGIARKPQPDSVLEALKTMGVSTDKAVYVGDSEIDVETAFRAGIPCISVLWGFRDEETLVKCQAKYFAWTPGEVLSLLEHI